MSFLSRIRAMIHQLVKQQEEEFEPLPDVVRLPDKLPENPAPGTCAACGKPIQGTGYRDQGSDRVFCSPSCVVTYVFKTGSEVYVREEDYGQTPAAGL